MAKSPLPKRRCPKTLEENLSVVARDRDEELTKLMATMDEEFKEGDIIMEHGGVYDDTIIKHLVPIAEKLNCKIYGVEHTESLIEHAKKNFPHPRVEYVCGDLTDPDFPLKDVKFNKIFSIYYLQMLTVDYRKELKAMYDLLAPGGQVILTIAHNMMAFDLLKFIKEHENFFEHGEDHMPDMYWIDQLLTNPEGWKEEIENVTGFKTIQLTSVEKEYTFEKLGIWVDLLIGFNSFAHDLPPNEKNILREAYMKHWLENDDKTEHHEYKLEYVSFNVQLIKD